MQTNASGTTDNIHRQLSGCQPPLLGAVFIFQLLGPLSQLKVGLPVAQRECRTVEGPGGANRELCCCSLLRFYRFNVQKCDCDGGRFIFAPFLLRKKNAKDSQTNLGYLVGHVKIKIISGPD